MVSVLVRADRLRVVAAWSLSAVLLLGCSSHEITGKNGPIIDGWPIAGEGAECDDRELCQAATDALRRRDGPHALIVSTQLYLGLIAANTRGNTIVVFTLADGSRRAIYAVRAPGGANPGDTEIFTEGFGPG